MHLQTWEKYIPVIKILIKRTSKAEQVFNLNSTDFPPPAASKKNTYKFSLHVKNGTVINNISTSLIAKDLAVILTGNTDIRSLIANGDYLFNLNTSNQLSIKQLTEEDNR